MLYTSTVTDTSNSYFEYNFPKELKKVIPHHLIDGPCSLCIIRAMCEAFCDDFIKFFQRCSFVEKQQLINFLDKKLDREYK